jgi:hypothetical protein
VETFVYVFDHLYGPKREHKNTDATSLLTKSQCHPDNNFLVFQKFAKILTLQEDDGYFFIDRI